MKLVPTHQIDIVADGPIGTIGLSTCMCLCIVTKNAAILWHYGILNKTQGTNMKRILALLSTIRDDDVLHVYLVPGADRDRDLALRPDCRTMRCRPNTSRTDSRDWFMNLLKDYSWSSRLQILEQVAHYKEFVVFNKTNNKCLYSCGRNDAIFDKICVVDAESMV